MENTKPDWGQGHQHYNFEHPSSDQFLGDGYVRVAQQTARLFGNVPGGNDRPAKGELQVQPQETSNYYLFADKSGEALAVVNVEVVGSDVSPGPPSITPPPGVNFSADRTRIQPGQTVKLSWSVPGASKVMISLWF